MRVLMYTPVFFPDPSAGGRAYSVRGLAEELSGMGVEVAIASYWRGSEASYRLGRVPVYRVFVKVGSRWLEKAASPLIQAIEASKLSELAAGYDLLHVNGPTYGAPIPPLKPLAFLKGWKRVARDKPFILHYRGALWPGAVKHIPRYGQYLRNLLADLEGARLALVIDERTAWEFKKLKPSLEVRVVYEYVDDLFIEARRIDEYPDRFTVLYVGGRIWYKGYRDVLLMKRVIKRMDPSIRFEIVGPGVRLVPHREMPRLYLSSSVLLLPSYREGLPRVALEALAMQRPVIASNVGGLPEVVKDGVTGFLLEPGDVKGFIAKILALKRDPDALKEMGKAGRRLVLEKFTRKKVAERVLEAYKKALG